jgi:hypothetical protein
MCFTGESGYKRLGLLFDCEDWGEKRHVSVALKHMYLWKMKKSKKRFLLFGQTL